MRKLTECWEPANIQAGVDYRQQEFNDVGTLISSLSMMLNYPRGIEQKVYPQTRHGRSIFGLESHFPSVPARRHKR